MTMDAIIRGEEQSLTRRGQGVGGTALAACPDFLTRTVPDLLPSDVQSSSPRTPSRAVKNSLFPTAVSDDRAAAFAARPDVLNEDGASLGTVRFPQLRTVDAVVDTEEQHLARCSQGGRITTFAARLDVSCYDGGGCGAV